MTPAVASERSIFSKNHDWNSYNYRVFRVAVNTYAPIFRGVDARGGRKLYTNRHTHTRDSHSDDNNKDYSKRCSSIGLIQRTVYIRTYAKPLNMKHMRHSGIIIKRNVSKHVTESIRNIARGVGIN